MLCVRILITSLRPLLTTLLDLESKRRVTVHNFEPEQKFVFRRVISPRKPSQPALRQREPPTRSSITRPSGIPQLITTQPGEEKGFIERYHRARSQDVQSSGNHQGVSKEQIPRQTLLPSSHTNVPKRFHLSQTTNAALGFQAGKRKRDVAVFVPESNMSGKMNDMGLIDEAPRKVQRLEDERAGVGRVRKRPGATAATPTTGTPRKQDIKDTDADMQDALQKYAFEEFGITYGQHAVTTTQEDVDVRMLDDTDDALYVYDTYERYVAHDTSLGSKASTMMDTQPSAPDGGYGILVMTEEQHELFLEVYGEDATSEDEEDWDSEQDDENAENYYAADYPEDEVDEDDERDLGAYEKYRRDEEEYDSDDAVYSADEGPDSERYPWTRRPWEQKVRTSDAAHAGDTDETSD